MPATVTRGARKSARWLQCYTRHSLSPLKAAAHRHERRVVNAEVREFQFTGWFPDELEWDFHCYETPRLTGWHVA